MKIRLGIIFGGETVEHEISIISAIQAMKNIDTDKYEIVPIYIAKDRTWYTGKMLMNLDVYKDFEDLKRYAHRVTLCKKDDRFFLVNTTGIFRRNVEEIDIAFPIVHGNNVEDGSLQGYLDTIGIPYVGPKVLGAALGQDKVIMKQVFASEGLPIVKYEWFYDMEYFTDAEGIRKKIKKMHFPVIVKPAGLGSSIGITKVEEAEDLNEAILEAIRYDHKIIVEEAVENLMEVNCSVCGNYEYQKVSVIEEVMGVDEILSYTDKYISGNKSGGTSSKGMAATNRVIPARISDKLTKEVESISKKVFTTLNLSGVCRIDYLIDKDTDKVYINEPNTIPGSLAFYLWKPIGVTYKQLLDDMITMSIKEFKNKTKKVYTFDTNVLSNFKEGNGSKASKFK